MMTTWSSLSAESLDVCKKVTSNLVEQCNLVKERIFKPNLKVS